VTHQLTPPEGQDCLGEGTYGIEIVRRRTPGRGAARLGELEGVLSGEWSRNLDGTSSASVTVALTPRCCEVFSQIRLMRYEIEVWRDRDLVWCGPITERTLDPEQETATLSARDLSYWFNLRAFRHTMRPKGIDLAAIFEGYCNYALGRGLPEWGIFFGGDPATGRVLADGTVKPPRPSDPPLYIDDFGLTLHVSPAGVTGDRTVYKHELKTVMSELEELGQTGVDWTVHNRHMYVGGQEVAMHGDGHAIRLPGSLGDDDFDTPPRLRETSDGMATEVITRANGARGYVGGPDPDDGIEITRILDEYSIEDDASAQAAAEGYYARGQRPLKFVEGAGALAADSPVTVQQLLPGARIQAAFEYGGCMEFYGAARLDSISASWGEDGEKVMAYVQPLGAAGADARGEGG
jgi:hypothetical protein